MANIYLLYHFFHPDDVISARLFSDMACDLAARGHRVVAMPSNRSCHDAQATFPLFEQWQGGDIRRVWRPALRNTSNLGRLVNAVSMLLWWTWRALVLKRSKNEVMIVGTDPVLGVLAAIPWRLLRPRARIIHWCHDVYPAAAVAQGLVSARSPAVWLLNRLLKFAYRRCDAIVDLGDCMRQLLIAADGKVPLASRDPAESRFQTLTPWALVEQSSPVAADVRIREGLFPKAQVGLLYSGNLGRAHIYQPFLDLARLTRDQPIGYCYAGRGPQMAELQNSITQEDENVRFAGFATEEELAGRLSAADIHMVSLHEGWTGTVVPSKFFGAIAVGRPVLFAGSRDSAIAKWIQEHEVGWLLCSEDDLHMVAKQLEVFTREPARMLEMQKHCHDVYSREFSKNVQLERWSNLVDRIL
jgi:colanic acid biosynthesis glycosyl transferase WcaI